MIKLYRAPSYSECLDKVASLVGEYGLNFETQCVIFTEDKLTLSVERKLADVFGGSFFTEVTSLNRFRKRNVPSQKQVLTKQGSVMAVKKTLCELGVKLNCIKSGIYSPSLPATMFELISQLKSAKVTADDLREQSAKLGTALNRKISDIAEIYSGYEKFLTDNDILDENNYLDLLADFFKNNETVRKNKIIFFGYNSFSRQVLNIIKTLTENAVRVDFVLIGGYNEELFTNDALLSLKRVIPDLQVVEDAIITDETRRVIAERLFEFKNKPAVKSDSIYVYQSETIYEELRHAASLIKLRIKKSQAKYRDFTIVVPSQETYGLALRRVFSDYGIPFFADAERNLSEHPLPKLFIDYLDAVRKNFDVKSLLELSKNVLFEQNRAKSNNFENYVLKYSISRKSIKKPFVYSSDGFNLSELEKKRQRLMEIFVGARKKGSAKEFTGDLKSLADKLDLTNILNKLSDKFSNEKDLENSSFNSQAFERVTALLDEIEKILKDTIISVDEFRHIFISGVTGTKVSLVPQNVDKVYVSDYKSGKLTTAKYLFCLGLNGDIPFQKSDSALLNDRDLKKLEDFGCVVEPKIAIVNKREKENLGVMFLSFSKNLFLSYSLIDAVGKEQRRSDVVDFFLNNFTEENGERLKPSDKYSLYAVANKTNARNRYEIYKNIELKPAIEGFLKNYVQFSNKITNEFYYPSTIYAAVNETLNNDEIIGVGCDKICFNKGEELFFKDGKISASALEAHFACPYSCFLQNGLKLQVREDGEVKSNEFGNFLHSVLEKYVKNIKKVNDKATSDGLVSEIVEYLLKEPEYKAYIDNDNYKTGFGFVREEAEKVCYAQYVRIKNSSFKPAEQEVKFGKGLNYDAIELNTPLGAKRIEGKVDRVDSYENYITVIDYKTGKVNASDSYFYSGNKLQLYLYANAFLVNNKQTAGAYYLPISDNYRKQSEKDNSRMVGKTLNDADLLCKIDNGITVENPECSSVKVTVMLKDEKPIMRKDTRTLDSKGFNDYLEYAKKISENGSDEMERGLIIPSPYKGTCDYCKFAAVCGYEDETDKTERSVGKKTAKDISSALIYESKIKQRTEKED